MKKRFGNITVFMAVVAMLAFVPAAQAVTLTPVASLNVDGSSPQTTFRPGEQFYVLVSLDDATNMAGAALTIEYNAAAFDVVGGTGEILNVQTDTFLEVFDQRNPPGVPSQEDPWVGNNVVTGSVGELKLSGAYIDTDPTTGGGGAYTGQKYIFKVKFQAKVVTVPSGPHNFTIKQTMLLNQQAGWGLNNFTEPQPAPFLIGAYGKTSTQWATPDVADDFFEIPATGGTVGITIDGEVAVIPGDLTGEGLVTMTDIMLAVQFYKGLLTPTAAQLLAIDTSGEGTISINELLAVVAIYKSTP